MPLHCKCVYLQSSHWVGTVLLNTCELIERPSKKDGFCFKLFHPLDQSIWATKVQKHVWIIFKKATFMSFTKQWLFFVASHQDECAVFETRDWTFILDSVTVFCRVQKGRILVQ